jgi:hypothetical protein
MFLILKSMKEELEPFEVGRNEIGDRIVTYSYPPPFSF